ncbi:MAG: hypothetical protein EON59_01455 [Alphaproteobacteria bacterium]|nr:MAG: hypothetical protein EON59_01455 [Alphaproteobacteria bacterium]
MPINDNDATNPGATVSSFEAHGHAALLLVESLIHGLCENSMLSNDQAVEIAERALSAQFDLAEAADGAGAPMWRAHTLLSAITASLKIDGGANQSSRT